MRALIATTRTQGERFSDFTWAEDGELVIPSRACHADQGDPDGGCGCLRAWTGLRTRRATTTAEVTEFPGLTADFVREVTGSQLRAHGTNASDAAPALATRVLDMAAGYPAGTVLEIRAGQVSPRTGIDITRR
jgi:hypothetical protein